jgi:hypothetical protein
MQPRTIGISNQGSICSNHLFTSSCGVFGSLAVSSDRPPQRLFVRPIPEWKEFSQGPAVLSTRPTQSRPFFGANSYLQLRPARRMKCCSDSTHPYLITPCCANVQPREGPPSQICTSWEWIGKQLSDLAMPWRKCAFSFKSYTNLKTSVANRLWPVPCTSSCSI